MKFSETKLPMYWSDRLYQEHQFNFDGAHFDKCVYTLFVATTELLNKAKSKEKPTSLIFEKLNNVFLAGATVEFISGENGEPGSWALSWTFDENDLPANTNKIYFNDVRSFSYFKSASVSKWGMNFKTDSNLVIIMLECLEDIKSWLDENAKEGEEVSIEVPDICQARVIIENGIKIFSLEADGPVKMGIKDDASLELAVA